MLRALNPLIVQHKFAHAATEFLSQLVLLRNIDRATLGMVGNDAVRVVAVSDQDFPAGRVTLPEVAAAMEESLLQDALLQLPAPTGTFPYILISHTELLRRMGLSSAMTVPLSFDGKLVGAITLESRRHEPLGAADAAFMTQLVAHAAPLLLNKWQQQRPLLTRCWHLLRHGAPESLRKLPRSAIGIFGVASVAVLIALAIVPAPERIPAQARVEALVQRVITSPIDGYLKEVRVRPGDRVQAGEVIAELNDDALRTEYRRLDAERAQQANTLAEAMARADRTQLAIRRAKLEEINAQKDFIAHQLAHTQLVAPFDGVVIKGDLTQLLGSPLRRGDSMLVLSQGNEYRVLLDVPEHEIERVQVGQTGTLVVSAMPGERFTLEVVRVSPVASVSASGKNGFEVEATVRAEGAPATALVPGLQGVARIDAGTRPLAQQWLTEGWARVRFLLWSLAG